MHDSQRAHKHQSSSQLLSSYATKNTTSKPNTKSPPCHQLLPFRARIRNKSTTIHPKYTLLCTIRNASISWNPISRTLCKPIPYHSLTHYLSISNPNLKRKLNILPPILPSSRLPRNLSFQTFLFLFFSRLIFLIGKVCCLYSLAHLVISYILLSVHIILYYIIFYLHLFIST